MLWKCDPHVYREHENSVVVGPSLVGLLAMLNLKSRIKKNAYRWVRRCSLYSTLQIQEKLLPLCGQGIRAALSLRGRVFLSPYIHVDILYWLCIGFSSTVVLREGLVERVSASTTGRPSCYLGRFLAKRSGQTILLRVPCVRVCSGNHQQPRYQAWWKVAPPCMLCSPPSIFNMGLNLTIFPITHRAQFFNHKQAMWSPGRHSPGPERHTQKSMWHSEDVHKLPRHCVTPEIFQIFQPSALIPTTC